MLAFLSSLGMHLFCQQHRNKQCLTNTAPPHFSNSAGIPLLPGDLLFFIAAIVHLISIVEISTSSSLKTGSCGTASETAFKSVSTGVPIQQAVMLNPSTKLAWEVFDDGVINAINIICHYTFILCDVCLREKKIHKCFLSALSKATIALVCV